MMTYSYNLNRKPIVNKDRCNHEKKNTLVYIVDGAFSRKRGHSKIRSAVFQALS